MNCGKGGIFNANSVQNRWIPMNFQKKFGLPRDISTSTFLLKHYFFDVSRPIPFYSHTVKPRKEEPKKLRTNRLFFRILYPLDKSDNRLLLGKCSWLKMFNFLQNLILAAFASMKILHNQVSSLIIEKQCLIVSQQFKPHFCWIWDGYWQ